MTLSEQIKHLLIRNQSTEAIAKIANLSQQEFEKSGQEHEGYLFDVAARHIDNPDVFHALIARYAAITNNKQLQPLTIDCHPSLNTTLDQAFVMGRLPIMRHISLCRYKELVEMQKTAYCHRILAEVKKLAVYGATLLLEVMPPPQKSSIEKAISHYQKNRLNQAQFNKILGDATAVRQDNLTWKKAVAVHQMTVQLLAATHNFLSDEFQSLASYQDKALNILRLSPPMLRSCRGIGKTLTDIGNAIARYSGIGLIASCFQGKIQDFMAGHWTLFSIKPKTQQYQDTLRTLITTLPSLN